ncbi:MAG: Cys-rich peptide radical SAM maturase CcpM [Oscillospiraceae bacterium]|jgi:uncharacterized protein|nr:Cys-rich peptide radical SAM maturase CcpM [Oscillospiraceae bacterium]
MPIFKTFCTLDGYYVYDRNTNSILTVDKQDFVSLQKFENKQTDENINQVIQRFQNAGYLLPSVIKTIQHPETRDLCEHIQRKTEQITLQITQNCNLRCDYCPYSGGYENRSHSNRRMSFEMAQKCIDYLISHSCENDKVALGFYGGEPLLEIQLIKDCVKYIQNNYSEKDINLTITTNGTLLTADIMDFLVAANFNIMLSMDGNKDVHDRHRKFINGQGTYDKVMRNLLYIKNNYPEYYHKITINTVISQDVDFKCVNSFYNTDDVVSCYSPKYSIVNTYNAKNYVNYNESFVITERYEHLKALLWLAGKLDEDRVSKLFIIEKAAVKRTHDLLKSAGALSEVCHPGGPCLPGARRPFVDVNGNIYPCERVSENSGIMKIGTIEKGIDIDKAKTLLNVGAISADVCSNCWGLIHCTQCAAAADGTQKLSRRLRLSRCSGVLADILEKFKIYCFLLEQGYDFENQGGLAYE